MFSNNAPVDWRVIRSYDLCLVDSIFKVFRRYQNFNFIDTCRKKFFLKNSFFTIWFYILNHDNLCLKIYTVDKLRQHYFLSIKTSLYKQRCLCTKSPYILFHGKKSGNCIIKKIMQLNQMTSLLSWICACRSVTHDHCYFLTTILLRTCFISLLFTA